MLHITLSNGNKVQYDIPTNDLTGQEALNILRTHFPADPNNIQFSMSRVEKEEHDSEGNLVVTLKSNATTKG